MMRLTTLISLGILASCASPERHQAADAVVTPPNAVCKHGPDGGPILADRGTGGTGARAATLVADRGIGGTGIGSGGLGIIGVVTGFASICVDGLEVRYDGASAVDMNGTPSKPDQLRAGHLVVIEGAAPSSGDPTVPRARHISIRTEVTGPIEAVEPGSGALMIGGQRVTVTPDTWGASRFALGDWTAVSGLRQADGTIVASRLDHARIGALSVRGQVSHDGPTTRIGNLVLHGAAAAAAPQGQFVAVAGTYAGDAVEVASLAIDRISADPTSYFGASVNQLMVQAFVRVERGWVWLNDSVKIPMERGVGGEGDGYGDAIVGLQRKPNGSFAATGVRYTSYPRQPKEPATSDATTSGVTVPVPVAPRIPPAVAAPTPTMAGPSGSGAPAALAAPAVVPASGSVAPTASPTVVAPAPAPPTVASVTSATTEAAPASAPSQPAGTATGTTPSDPTGTRGQTPASPPPVSSPLPPFGTPVPLGCDPCAGPTIPISSATSPGSSTVAAAAHSAAAVGKVAQRNLPSAAIPILSSAVGTASAPAVVNLVSSASVAPTHVSVPVAFVSAAPKISTISKRRPKAH